MILNKKNNIGGITNLSKNVTIKYPWKLDLYDIKRSKLLNYLTQMYEFECIVN